MFEVSNESKSVPVLLTCLATVYTVHGKLMFKEVFMLGSL